MMWSTGDGLSFRQKLSNGVYVATQVVQGVDVGRWVNILVGQLQSLGLAHCVFMMAESRTLKVPRWR